MLADEVRTMYGYNRWATGRILDCCEHLTPEQFVQPDDTPHGSIRNSLLHMIDVQWGWLSWADGSLSGAEAYQRSAGAPEDFPDVASIRALWERVETQTDQYISSLTDEDTQSVLSTAWEGGEFSVVKKKVLIHLITHATQHRSEIAMSLTRLGQSPGDLDYIFYPVGERAAAS